MHGCFNLVSFVCVICNAHGCFNMPFSSRGVVWYLGTQARWVKGRGVVWYLGIGARWVKGL